MDQEAIARAGTEKREVPPTLAERVHQTERNTKQLDYAMGVTQDLLQQICRELGIPMPSFNPPTTEPLAEHRAGRY